MTRLPAGIPLLKDHVNGCNVVFIYLENWDAHVQVHGSGYLVNWPPLFVDTDQHRPCPDLFLGVWVEPNSPFFLCTYLLALPVHVDNSMKNQQHKRLQAVRTDQRAVLVETIQYCS